MSFVDVDALNTHANSVKVLLDRALGLGKKCNDTTKPKERTACLVEAQDCLFGALDDLSHILHCIEQQHLKIFNPPVEKPKPKRKSTGKKQRRVQHKKKA